MQIPLHQFEQVIDETILKKGFSYFKRERVHEPEEIAVGLYEALVEGTENYTVRLRFKNGNITEQTCDCPYDSGPVCKHMVAVIFCLQQGELGMERSTHSKKTLQNRGEGTKSRSAKQKTPAQQVDEVLASLSVNELTQFIRGYASNDATFRNRLLSSFVHLYENESKVFYTQQLKSILKAAAARNGYIDRYTVKSVRKSVDNILQAAQKHLDSGNYQSAMVIAGAVLEEMTKALQFADDSNADIGSLIYAARQLLVDMASVRLPEEIRKQLLDYTLKSFHSGVFAGWDWHLGMLEIAAAIFDNEKEAAKIISVLDQVKRGEYEYEYTQAQLIKLQVLKKTEGEKEAEKFREQNLDNRYMRAEAIQIAISEKDYKKGVKLAEDGIKQDAKDKPGLVKEWYNWLLKIAIEQQDSEKIIQYARILFVDSYQKERQQYYYDVLKNNVDQNQWEAFVEQLVNDITKKDSWATVNFIAFIYINEQSWEKLLTLLEQEVTKGVLKLEGVKEYEKYLVKNFAGEVAKFYELGIINLMEKNVGRVYYKNACRFIRRIIKIGEKEKADKLIEKLRVMYPQRKALMEELENI